MKTNDSTAQEPSLSEQLARVVGRATGITTAANMSVAAFVLANLAKDGQQA